MNTITLKHQLLSTCLTAILVILSMVGFTQTQNALYFDNVDDYVDVPGASVLIAQQTAMSLTCWVYPENTNITFPDYDGFCGFRNNTDADFYLVQHAPTSVEARFRNAAGTAADVVITNLQINAWQFFVFTYNGTEIKLYRNGVLVGTTPATGAILNSTASFYVGDMLYGAVHYYMKGKVDEVSLWTKALTQEEISLIYNCAINPTAGNLVLYYKFDQGIAGGNNAGVTTLNPTVGTLTGTLHNFALTGATSNWVAGVSTPVYNINASICEGEGYQFDTLYITAPGVYTQTYVSSTGCDSIVQLTLTVKTVNTSVTLFSATLTAGESGAAYQWVDCNNGYAQVQGAVSQSFSPVANGSYAVIVTKDGCTDTSTCVNVTTVGIADNNGIAGLMIYPNPVEEVLNIDLGYLPGEVNVTVFNADGRTVTRTCYSHSGHLVQKVSGLAKGVYFVSIEAGKQRSFLRFIK
ncbi:MAG: T9SS type A sorting domain-containing protein [Bacteroidetes bacterium]|nr:T9SS type A sorting domain-containing protein [Bacteroidota bacterium]